MLFCFIHFISQNTFAIKKNISFIIYIYNYIKFIDNLYLFKFLRKSLLKKTSVFKK